MLVRIIGPLKSAAELLDDDRLYNLDDICSAVSGLNPTTSADNNSDRLTQTQLREELPGLMVTWRFPPDGDRGLIAQTTAHPAWFGWRWKGSIANLTA